MLSKIIILEGIEAFCKKYANKYCYLAKFVVNCALIFIILEKK